MPWAGGTYNRLLDWTDDRAAGVNPQASRFDSDADDMAAGISACLHTGGQNALTADVSAGNNKITSLGTPTADTDAANKAYVDSVGTPGDLKFSVDSTARTGWICYSTGDFTVADASKPSVGNGSSGGITRANADTADLFTILYDTYSNTICPLQDSSGVPTARGASAAADFAADRRLVLPDVLGRTLGVAGTSGDTTNVPTARSTGDSDGAETHRLTTAEMPEHDHGLAAGGYRIGTGLSLAQSGSSFNAMSGAVGQTNWLAVGNNPATAHDNQSPVFFLHIHMKL